MLWQALVVALVCLFIYAPAYHSGWLWDDDAEITQNAVLPNPTGLIAIWQGPVGADYLPIKSTVQWLLWRLFNAEPTGYHLFNVALHLANALLLWHLFSRLKMPHAWISGLLFVAHPVFVESVMWVSELKNTLSLLFLLGAMLAWLDFEERGRRWDYARTTLFYLAALLSKSSVVMFPAVILLHAWWKHGRISRREIKASLPLFALSLAVGAVTVWFQWTLALHRTDSASPGGLASHLALAGLAAVFYLSKLALPAGLLPIYPRWTINPPSLAQFLPWPLLAGLLAGCWAKRKSWGRHALFGLGFFLLNVLPVLGFFRMSFMRNAWVSDHLIYLPAIGIVGLAAAGAGRWYDRTAGDARTLARVAGVVMILLLAFGSRRYVPVFASEKIMWEYTLRDNPDSWGAHLALTLLRANQGDHEQALIHAIAAERLKPDAHETQNNLSLELGFAGKLPEAALHALEAHRLAPWDQGIARNCAVLLFQTRQYAEAAQVYESLAVASPNDVTVYHNWGVCLFYIGKIDDAIAQYRRALALDPNYQDAKRDLETALRARDPSMDAAERGFAH